MTTVLYVMKDRDHESSEDLRLSLRSLNNAFPEDDIRVVVATAERPAWFKGVHVTVSDLGGSWGKHWSMLHKVCESIKTLSLSDPFLFSADDHIAPLEPPCRISEWPHLARRMSIDRFVRMSDKRNTRWRRSVGWARSVLDAHYGKSATGMVLCTHRNTWTDPRCLSIVEKLFPLDENFFADDASMYGPTPDDVFGYIALAEGWTKEEDYMRVRDVKRADPLQFFDMYLSDAPPGRFGLSLPPGADAVRAPLWRIFKRPSRWELA